MGLDRLLYERHSPEPFALVSVVHLLEQSGSIARRRWRGSRGAWVLAATNERRCDDQYVLYLGCHRVSLMSCSTISAAVRPAASAAKLMTIRCVRTVGATVRRSSSSAIGRPSSAARALAPRAKYCDARGPAPQEMNSLMKAGAAASGGRVIRTSVTAALTSACDTGIRRTRCCIASTSSAVSTLRTSAAASPVVAVTICSSSVCDG